MSTLETLLRGKLLADRYRLEQTIGVGGMGAVFQATDERLQRRVAVKVIQLVAGSAAEHTHLRKRFHREAQVLARLHHRNVVTVHDFGTDQPLELDFLVMELLSGQDLLTTVADSGPPPLPVALEILRQAARGLAVGHREGLVHRDVKPGNLFLVDEDDADDIQVKVLDFGIVQLTQSDALTGATGTALTRRGAQPGTLRYMSPEQRGGAPTLTPASDVYSLGVVGFELLTGSEPFCEVEREKISQALTVPIPSLHTRRPDLPPIVDDLIRRSLQPDSKSRFQSAAEFEVALRAAIRTVAAAGPTLRSDAHQPNDSRRSAGILIKDDTGASDPPPWARTPFENDQDVTTDIGIGPDQNQKSSTGEPYARVAPLPGRPEVNRPIPAGTENLPSGNAVPSAGRLVRKAGYMEQARTLSRAAAEVLRAHQIRSRLPLVLVMAAVLGIAGAGLALISSRQTPVTTASHSATDPTSYSVDPEAAPKSDTAVAELNWDAEAMSTQPPVRAQRPVVNNTVSTRNQVSARPQSANPARVIPPASGRGETPSHPVQARQSQPSPPAPRQRATVAQAPSRQQPNADKSAPHAGAPSTRTPASQSTSSAGQRTAVTSPPPASPPPASTPSPPVTVAETPLVPSPPAQPADADLLKIRRYVSAGQALQGVGEYRAAGFKYDSASAYLADLSRRFAGSERIQNLRADIVRTKTRNENTCRVLQKVDQSTRCP